VEIVADMRMIFKPQRNHLRSEALANDLRFTVDKLQ
jgi:hypothetical protein